MTSHPDSTVETEKAGRRRTDLPQDALTGTGRQARIMRKKSFAGMLYPGKIIFHPQSLMATERKEDKDHHV